MSLPRGAPPEISANLSMIRGAPFRPPPPTIPVGRARFGRSVEFWRICVDYGRFLDVGEIAIPPEASCSALVGRCNMFYRALGIGRDVVSQ